MEAWLEKPLVQLKITPNKLIKYSVHRHFASVRGLSCLKLGGCEVEIWYTECRSGCITVRTVGTCQATQPPPFWRHHPLFFSATTTPTACLYFSTRLACKRNLHLNSILNSYAGCCNTHQRMGQRSAVKAWLSRQDPHTLRPWPRAERPPSCLIVLPFRKFSTMDFRLGCSVFVFVFVFVCGCVFCNKLLHKACTFMFHSCT